MEKKEFVLLLVLVIGLLAGVMGAALSARIFIKEGPQGEQGIGFEPIGYISIPAAAFLPQTVGASYYRNLTQLYDYTGPYLWWTPLNLPNGVTLTKMTAFLFDDRSDGYVILELWGFNLTGNSLLGIMAQVATSYEGYSSETQVLYDETIWSAKIDNKNCQYALRFQLVGGGSNLTLKGVIIEYEYPT